MPIHLGEPSTGLGSESSPRPDRPIRILHAVRGMVRGGIQTWLMHVLRRMDRNEYAMDFLVDGERVGAYDDEARSLGARIIPHSMPSRKHPFRSLTFTKTLRQVLRDYGPYDVVHSHHYKFSGFVLRCAARTGVKTRIAHSHSAQDLGHSGVHHGLVQRWRYRLYSRWIDRFATAGLACSKGSALALFGPTWELDPRWNVLYYGIDLTPFHGPIDRDALRRDFGIDRGAMVVGHVGNFLAVKNHGFLLDVAAHCRKRDRRIIFLLLGDGPLKAETQAAAERLGLGSTVLFAGSRGDIPRVMRGTMDLLVLPSLWEGFGIVAIEAQAAGVPVLTSDRVPEEVAILPGMVQRAPLEDGAEAWASRVLAQLAQPRPSQDEAVEALSDSPYNIDRSVAALKAFYCRTARGL